MTSSHCPNVARPLLRHSTSGPRPGERRARLIRHAVTLKRLAACRRGGMAGVSRTLACRPRVEFAAARDFALETRPDFCTDDQHRVHRAHRERALENVSL